MPQPLIFRINSMRTTKIVYCGVLEFVAPDDTVVLPNWIFINMQLMEEELVNIFMVPSIPTANFLKIRPHQTAFINLPDPKAFLEIKFRDFVCLTVGDTITVKTDLQHNPEFKFDIMELKPVSPYKTVSIINCDLNLDFDPPLDYVEAPPEPTLSKRQSSVLMEDGKPVLRQKRTRKNSTSLQASTRDWMGKLSRTTSSRRRKIMTLESTN